MNKIVKKIKFFFDVLVKSLTKFQYYKEIKKAKFSFSVKYLFFLFYLVSLIGSIVFAGSLGAIVLPKVPGFINTFESKANSLYPTGLVVTIKDGKVSTNEKEPIYIDSLNQFGLAKNYAHSLTIDTNASPSDIKNKNTAVLVTADTIVTVDNTGTGFQSYPIDKSTNTTINQGEYNKLITQISPYLKYIEPGIIILIILSIVIWPFIAAGLSLAGQLIYLLIFTAIFYLILKLMKKEYTFKKLLQLDMHGSTLPILLSFIVAAVGIQMPPLLGSAILFVFMMIVINQI
ncbi:MAG TPA: DUF1189 family protein [Patescibacteria group bacterium]|nr:DUF1189 family protein [Patescibacteria group bacterium]